MREFPPPALSVRQVAAYLSVNEKTVYRLAQRGDLPGFKVAGAWRFQRADLDEWIARQKRAAKGSLGDVTKPSARRVERHRNSGNPARARDSR